MANKFLKTIKGWFTSWISIMFILIICFGGLAGAYIQFKRGDEIGVALSLLVPGYGAVITFGELRKHF
jgi:type IV secretory pathway VirB2 component (pilin)